MKSKERCWGYGKFSGNIFFPQKFLLARGEVAKEAERMSCATENCGNIKSLPYLRIFFFSLWIAFLLCGSVLLWGIGTAEENAGGCCWAEGPQAPSCHGSWWQGRRYTQIGVHSYMAYRRLNRSCSTQRYTERSWKKRSRFSTVSEFFQSVCLT